MPKSVSSQLHLQGEEKTRDEKVESKENLRRPSRETVEVQRRRTIQSVSLWNFHENPSFD